MDAVSINEGRLWIGQDEMPGIVQSVEVSSEVRTKEMSVDGGSGSANLPQGYSDAEVRIVVVLAASGGVDPEDQLRFYEQKFKATDDQVQPETFRVIHRHINARGIREMIFKRHVSREASGSNTMTVELELVEHRPAIIKKERERRARRRAALALMADLQQAALRAARDAAKFGAPYAAAARAAAVEAQQRLAELRAWHQKKKFEIGMQEAAGGIADAFGNLYEITPFAKVKLPPAGSSPMRDDGFDDKVFNNVNYVPPGLF
jgi:hypothetical protein